MVRPADSRFRQKPENQRKDLPLLSSDFSVKARFVSTLAGTFSLFQAKRTGRQDVKNRYKKFFQTKKRFSKNISVKKYRK